MTMTGDKKTKTFFKTFKSDKIVLEHEIRRNRTNAINDMNVG